MSTEHCTKKIALVTGSASGIGADVAINLAADGFFVIVTGRNEEKMQKVVDECDRVARQIRDDTDDKLMSSATFFRADLLDLVQVEELIEFVRVKFKRLDVLVNNACWRGEFKQLLECDRAYDDFKQVMHLNVSVPIYLINRCVIPLAMMNKTAAEHETCVNPSDPAIVINMSSVAGQIVVPLHLYSISKACLTELTRQLAQSDIYEQTGILSVTISPGPVLTDTRPHHAAMSNMTLLHRVGSTKEVANLVMFAISNARLFQGKEITIDGGYMTKQKIPTT